MLIRETLKRDLSRKIEEIIKVDQAEEAVVYEELSEYVVTPSIRDHYQRILSAIAEAPTSLTESVGIWISGFFGSGKSSFAKNLGYVLENRSVSGEKAADIFKRRVGDQRVANLIDAIHAKFPTKAIMFDVQSDRSLGPESRSIAHYMYRVLLRELGYAEDFDLAELEMTLEDDGKLNDFCARVERRYAEPWAMRRKKALKMSEASAILHDMDSSTYPSPDSWAKGRAGKSVEATPNLIVERSYDLMRRRLPGQALVYIIDEVGQYIARSSDRIEDVRRVVELLGKEGRSRVQARKAVAPVWFVATSQERLDEVTSAIGDTKVLMAKVQDRFPIRVDLSPSDIRQIVVKRVLDKKPESVPDIREMFEKAEGALKTHAALERTYRRQEFDADSFVEFHPYLPHQIDTLSIDIVSGIRLQPGADRTIGGATRTIIKQAYEMLVNQRTGLADEPLGTLVTLDKLYELLEPSLGTEVRKEVDEVDKRFPDDLWCGKVIRTVVLLGFVKDLPRTTKNIAALLYPALNAPSALPDVERAVGKLVDAQHIREAEDGYSVLTTHEKTWQQQKQGIEVKPRHRNELVEQLLENVFGEPAFQGYRYGSRHFSVNAVIRGVGAGKGGITLEVRRAESPDKLDEAVDATRIDSRKTEFVYLVYWVFPLNETLDAMVAELVRSNEVVRRYEQLRAQNKINAEESSTLDEEKRQAGTLEARLRAKLTEALLAGQLLFQGTSRDVSSLASSAPEALRKFLDDVVPKLYPNLRHGAVAPKPNDVDDILKAANLDALPEVYSAGRLELFLRSDGRVQFNFDAPVARDIQGYLKDRVDYGEKPTGRQLEDYFSSPPYGWEPDVLRAALAGLYRGGQIRITTKGRTYDDYTERESWSALSKIPDFRAATFAPQVSVDIADVVKAREAYVRLTGNEVDVDQQKISRALGELVSEELAQMPELIAEARARQLPVVDQLDTYHQELVAIQREDVQKRIALLAQEGAALKSRRDEVHRLRDAMSEGNLKTVSQARAVLASVWPTLKSAGASECAGDADSLQTLLATPEVFEKLKDVKHLAESIQRAFDDLFAGAHERRNKEYSAALENLEGEELFPQLSPEDRDAVLRPITSRICEGVKLEMGENACSACRASIEQIESDIAAVGQYEANARRRLLELTAPGDTMTVVKAARYFGRVETAEDVERGVEALKEDLLKAVSEGSTVVVE